MPITALPTPPSRQDPTNFNDRADAFLGALPLFQSEANTLQTDVNAKQLAAATSATNAAASELAAANTSGATIWISGTTYAVGANRFSPVNFLTYRRKTAGAGTTDPSADATNWQLLTGLGDVTLSSAQTVTGVKTFSNGIVSNVTGNVTGNLTGNVTGTVSGNAGTVTNGVYTTGDQTINGVKTFTSGIRFNDGTTQATAGGSSFGISGWRRDSSGMIFQWGRTELTSGAVLGVSFPIAFTSACQGIQTCVASSGDRNEIIQAYGETTGGFTLRNSNPATVTAAWLAYGY